MKADYLLIALVLLLVIIGAAVDGARVRDARPVEKDLVPAEWPERAQRVVRTSNAPNTWLIVGR